MQSAQSTSLVIKNKWQVSQHKTNANTLIISLLQTNWNRLLPFSSLQNSKLLRLNSNKNTTFNSAVKNPFYNNFTSVNFRLSGLSSNLDYSPNSVNLKKPKTVLPKNLKKSLLKLFTVFVRVNMSSQNELTVPHHTFRSFYLTRMKGGLTIITLSKLFQRWKNCYLLIFNLYYHNVNVLTFSPSFFKKEVLALNWVFHKNFQFMWRYTRSFLVHKPNKITNHGDFVFRKLRSLGLSIGVVTDVLYHTKTIYYLKRNSFYSIGLVPTIYNAYTVDFAIPTAYESIFTQVFFVRFLIRTKQDASSVVFNDLGNLWSIPAYDTVSIPSDIAGLNTTYSFELE